MDVSVSDLKFPNTRSIANMEQREKVTVSEVATMGMWYSFMTASRDPRQKYDDVSGYSCC